MKLLGTTWDVSEAQQLMKSGGKIKCNKIQPHKKLDPGGKKLH